jgi:O-antigen/teichoic acid export membrane protein
MAGADFARHAYLPLVMFCVVYAVNAQNIIYTFSTYAVGRIHASVVAETSASVLTVLSNLILIPWLGYMGVCWAALWKIPAVLLQSIWSRRLLGLSRSLRAEWAPYLSPATGALAWLGVAGLSRLLAGGQPYLALALSLVLGGTAYLATVWYLETGVLSPHRRWETVSRTVGLLRARAAAISWRTSGRV